MVLAAIPSPTQTAWPVAGFPVRAYALCIIAGIIVALWLTARRWRQRGGQAGTVADIATWAVPFGLVGARLYHVITDYQLYFADGRNPWAAFAVWEGGLGIWGAVAGGAVGAWIACRRRGIPLPAFADAAAPGIVLAQAIGRWGNWFNNELYGGPTDLPWALTVHEIDPSTFSAVTENGAPVVLGQFHPTFLYESLWCVGVAVLVIWADRRFTLGHGRVFALYVAAYTVGRAWIEWLRVDPAHEFFGLRLNVWTCFVVFAGAVVYLLALRGRPRETVVEPAAVAEGSKAEVRASAAEAAAVRDEEVADDEDADEDGSDDAADDEDLEDVAATPDEERDDAFADDRPDGTGKDPS
ncbi:MAG: prolipoprotein diacylglyceryl transferase [Streptosporangiales bacterium]|nr:prolipoprotein diacylglyceryl transferase [Streptosporangiales bacterium]